MIDERFLNILFQCDIVTAAYDEDPASIEFHCMHSYDKCDDKPKCMLGSYYD